jgi:zeaxanthin epoxidase
MDEPCYNQIVEKSTITGDKENGIKDVFARNGKFDFTTPASNRNLPYTGVIDRPDLQAIYLDSLPKVPSRMETAERYENYKWSGQGDFEFGKKSSVTS